MSIHVPPNAYRVKMTFFSLKLCRLTPPSYTHSFPLTKPSVVWVPAYMIVIPVFTEVGLVPQRQSEKCQRCQRAQSHSLSASLLPFPRSHTLLLGHVLPRHPQNHSPSLSTSLARPSFTPVRSTPNGWWVNTDRSPQARPGLLPHYNHKELPHFWVEPVAAGGSGAFKWVAYLIGFV